MVREKQTNDAFSAEAEAKNCETVMGNRRHGLGIDDAPERDSTSDE